MNWVFVIGATLCVWAILRVMGGERTRRLIEAEIRAEQQEFLRRKAESEADAPTVVRAEGDGPGRSPAASDPVSTRKAA